MAARSLGGPFAPAFVVIGPFVQIFNRIGLIDTYAGLILAHVLVCIALVVWVMRELPRLSGRSLA